MLSPNTVVLYPKFFITSKMSGFYISALNGRPECNILLKIFSMICKKVKLYE